MQVSRSRWGSQLTEVVLGGNRPLTVMVLLVAVASAYWLWFGLANRSIDSNDGISLLAIEGILEHGYQKLPSGYIYSRGYIPHYLAAASIKVFGFNELSYKLPSLAMGLGVLWLVYLFAKDVVGRSWLGVTTAMVLLALQVEAMYATSPRMYMALQFFTILAAYSTWRGFVLGQGKFQVLTYVAVACAILSHRLGVVLLVALPVSAVAAVWLRGQGPPRVSLLLSLVAWSLMVIGAAFFYVVYEPPGRINQVTDVVVGNAGPLGLNTNLQSWFMDSLSPGRAVIYVLALMPMGVFISIGLFRGRWREARPAMTYALLIATISAMAILFGTVRTSPRFFLFVLPFYALLLSGSLFAVSEAHSVNVIRWLQRQSWRFKTAGTLVLMLGLTLLALGYLAVQERYERTITQFVSPVIGPSCGGGGIHCDRGIKMHHLTLRDALEPDDLIVSSEPFVAYHYLGRVDGYLRDKVVVEEWNEKISSYDYLEDEYFGIPLIDARDLEVLLNGEDRVWVITGPKVQWTTSEEIREFLKHRFRLIYKDDLLATYVNCIAPPCGPANGQ